MKEYHYEKLLNIKTREEKHLTHASLHYNRYEPTPYSALDHLFANYQLESSDQVVDFGCGKGRLIFYIHHFFQVSCVGIEMDERLYHNALTNRNNYFKQAKKAANNIDFYHTLAEHYKIHPKDNRFYFFNPFSIVVFMKIVNKILKSVEKSERNIELVLYYPPLDYIYFLEHHTNFQLKQDVRIPYLFEKNPNERFLIYEM